MIPNETISQARQCRRTYPRSAAVLGDGSVSEATLAAARQAVNACPEQAIGLVD